MGESGVTHDFYESLKKSHEQANAPFLVDVYRKAFGSSLASCVCVRNDGWAQRGGIDRVLTLSKTWFENKDQWLREHKIIRAKNVNYVTVPTDILLNSIRDAMLVNW